MLKVFVIALCSLLSSTMASAALSSCNYLPHAKWGALRNVARDNNVSIKKVTVCRADEYPIYYGVSPFTFNDTEADAFEKFFAELYDINGNKAFTFVDVENRTVIFVSNDEGDGLTYKFSKY